ncbi:hypothetical protein L226DRAFT_576901 [Lentinus tigrinus ALCF2SS1-7]|uniref:Uncharacterized protein n=1 Tax=Lentinus tigrinus ALCF2SS1-6 TaxID=1328759 RepID=A0A5C2RLC0_9APHY|nr:hypothetical protein L227DRAFT_617855 [Lentinus tigrinus ALCF2SS1-6]RPD67865.1 hypothetical protein L226DRAFT_576901 [Lentinus tigrinus ALCF2SS1-7]
MSSTHRHSETPTATPVAAESLPSFHALFATNIRIPHGERLPDICRIANLLVQDLSTIPGFLEISSEARCLLVTAMIDSALELALGHHTHHSFPAERMLSHAERLVDASPTYHIHCVIFPDGRRMVFPTPHSSIPLRRVEVYVLGAVDSPVTHSNSEQYVDIDDAGTSSTPPLVD